MTEELPLDLKVAEMLANGKLSAAEAERPKRTFSSLSNLQVSSSSQLKYEMIVGTTLNHVQP